MAAKGSPEPQGTENPFSDVSPDAWYYKPALWAYENGVASGTAFFATAGVLLYTYTPLVRWVGYIFYPFMQISIPAEEAVTACTGAAVSFIEVTIPALLVTVGEWSLRTRYMMAVIPVSSIIFLASFVPLPYGHGYSCEI